MLSEIIQHLPGHPWRHQIQYFDTIDSTNTYAKKLASEGAPHGTVIIAGHQTGGRGRMGRSFSSPPGMGVYLSLILRPDCKPEELMHLTCASAVASCDAVMAAAGSRPQVKWTNDLICGQHKIAGILTELVISPGSTCAIIGIGINCCQQTEDFPREIQSFAASLEMVTGKPVDRALLIAQLIKALFFMDSRLLQEKEAIMEQYCRDCATVGQDISLVSGNSIRHGHATGISPDGGLIVRFTDGSTQTVQSGEVSVRGMYGYV